MVLHSSSLNGLYLSEETHQKDLGVTISNNLKPFSHIANITNKAKQKTGMIRRCFHDMTKDKIVTVYGTIIPIRELRGTTQKNRSHRDI